MKVTLKGALSLAICTVFFYTACKKADTAPKDNTASEKDVSVKVAQNLGQAFSGAHGGVNLNEGIAEPAILINNHRSLSVNANPVSCGFRVDSSVHYTTNSGGVLSIVNGRFIFSFTCSPASGGKPDGFLVYSAVTDTGKAATYHYDYRLDQQYNIVSLNKFNTLISLDGGLTSFGNFFYSNPIYKPARALYGYKLHNLHVDLTNNLDVVSGTADFTAQGYNAFGAFNITGTLTFLGNHLVNVTIGGKTYKVNWQTGQIV